MRLGAARTGGSPASASQAAWVAARPNSLLAGFPQRHVRSLAARLRDEPEDTVIRWRRSLLRRGRAQTQIAAKATAGLASALRYASCTYFRPHPLQKNKRKKRARPRRIRGFQTRADAISMMPKAAGPGQQCNPSRSFGSMQPVQVMTFTHKSLQQKA